MPASMRAVRPIATRISASGRCWTWAQVLDEVRAFSVGLTELGLKRGDKVAIVGSNRPRLYWAMCAAQALGAVPVPIYADSVAEEMAYVLDHAEVAIAVVEDQEQVDKLLSIADRLPRLGPSSMTSRAGCATTTTSGSSLSPTCRSSGRDRSPPMPRACNAGKLRSRRARARTSPSSSTPRARPAGPRA